MKLKLEDFTGGDTRHYHNRKILVGSTFLLICPGTFANCQNLTIGNFCALVNAVEPSELTNKLLEIKELDSTFHKPIAIVDVKLSIYTKMKKFLPIRTATPYTSTNGSEMVLVLIDFSTSVLKNFRPKETVKKRSI